MTVLDALSLAIFYYEGGNTQNPQIRNLRNNNPGNLRPYDKTQPTDGDNYRVFPTFIAGFQSLQADIMHKVAAHMFKDSTLLDFMNLYAPAGDHNNPTAYAQYIVRFMTRTGLSVMAGQPVTTKTTIEQLFPGVAPTRPSA